MGPLGSAGNSLSSHDLPWGHPQNGSKACQDSHEVRSNRGARLGWQILGEKAIDRARGHQEEDSLAQEQPEHQASCKEDKPLGPAQGSHGLAAVERSEEHTSELQSLRHLVCRLLLEKKKFIYNCYRNILYSQIQ